MKISAIINYSILTTILLTFSSVGMTQMIGTEAYAIGDHVEFGINADGHEGAPDLAGSNARSSSWSADVYFGFVSNPQTDGWGNYDGDFFSPGTPENGFGIEVGGTNYSNNASTWPTAPEIPGSITSYNEVGDCIEIVWDGAVAGVEVNVLYKLIKTELYYSTTVTLTNTTAGDLMDVYYYRNFDPDNNQSIGWGFPTTNTVVSQPDPDCEIALVSAEQFNIWDNYIGLGAIGQDFRVTHGGFSNRNASDIWNAAGFLEGTEGAVSAADQAISLAYHIDNLEAGTAESFQFVVIMSEDDVDAAIASLYHFDYVGSGGGVIDECNPEVDTVYMCEGQSVEISVAGPSSSDYTWDWSPTTDITPTTGPTVTADPTTETTYTVVGTPVAGCLTSTIEKQIVVKPIPSPDIEVIDPGPQCDEFDLSTLVVNDLAGLPVTFTEFYSVAPDSSDQIVGVFPGTTMYDGDDVWVLLGSPDNSCFDSLKLDIDFGGSGAAGADNADDICNTAGTTVTMDDYLSVGADAGGQWTEVSATPSGSFNTTTSELDAGGLDAGAYTFEYVAFGIAPCPNDTALITINIVQKVNAGDDNTAEICNNPGSEIDLNTLLSTDADLTGTWTEDVASGGFDGTSVLDGDGLTPSDYTYTYTVAGVAPCPSDDASFTVTVLPPPPVEANEEAPFADIEICEDESLTLTGTGAGTGGIYIWDNGISQSTPFVQDVGTVTYTVTGTDASGCWATDEVDVITHPTPTVDFEGDKEGCTPFDAQFIGESDPAAASCLWTFGDGSSSTSCGEAYNRYEHEGDYDVSLEVTSIHGCVNSIEKEDYIHIVNTPEADFTFSPQRPVVEETEVEFENGSLYANSYEWDFGDGTPLNNEESPTHEFPPNVGNIDYAVTLTAVNELGCTDEVTKIVHVDDIIIFYIPNIFTPDGDEFNETFKPVFYSGIDPYDFHMTIWNRYGEVVFESYNPSAGWDGTYGSRGLVQDGTYIWQLDFKENMSDKRHKHHGHVTILK